MSLLAATVCSSSGRPLQRPLPCSRGLTDRQARSSAPAAGARCRAAGRHRRSLAAAASGSGDGGEQPANFGPDAPGGGEASSSGASIPDALPVFSEGSDWRTFRAQLVASARAAEGGGEAAAARADDAWAHRLPAPEQGCLLLANPIMFMDAQQYFWMSVILICQHDEGGSWGLILNRPTEYRIADLSQVDSLRPEFDDCQLWLGGDVGPEATHLLHGVPGLAGSMEVLPGVFLGGFQAAKAGLGEGRLAADDFRLFTRYAGWGPGQLEAEVRRGVWIPVSASAAAVLRRGLPAGLGGPVAARQVDHLSRPSVAALWHFIARLTGGDLAQLAGAVEGETDPEIAAAAAAGGVQQQAAQQQAPPPPSQQQQAEAQQQQQQQPGDPGDSSRAAGGGLPQDEAEEADGDCSDGARLRGSGAPHAGGRGGDPSQLHRAQQARWQQHRRRTRLPESDYRDGAGI